MNVRIVLFLLMPLFALSRGLAAEPLRYEPAVVQLTGILNVEEFFGPPNYGETPAEDRIEGTYVLRLDRPMDVAGDPGSDLNAESLTNVRRVQLVPNSQPLGSYVGQHISVEGTLFHSFTGHHVTDVLLTVTNIRSLKR